MNYDFINRASEIAKELNSVVLGLGHVILAAREYEKSAKKDILSSYIDKSAMDNGYLREYVRFIYSSENTAPIKSGFTPFMTTFIAMVKEINDNNELSNKEKIEDFFNILIGNNAFDAFTDNFADYLYEYEFDTEKKFDKQMLKQNNSFKEFEFVKNLNMEVAENNPTIIGREKELYKLESILLKKNKSNAILVGDAGTGKTAIVEKLCQLINTEKINKNLKDYTILDLNVSGLISGTKYRGDFEAKIGKFLDKLENEKNVILFIDEIHTIMDAGGAEGAVSASNILKPALARGKIKVIGATTWDEYRKFINKDKAFSRRFERIEVEEPTEEETLKILHGLKTSYESFHNVSISNESMNTILDLTKKYISDKKFPDKAIDVLDTACVETKLKAQKELTKEIIISVVEAKANVKIKKEVNKDYKSIIEKTIKGQSEAVEEVDKTLRLIDLGLVDNNKPLSVMLFTGPTGVGKTEMAKQIANVYFGSESKLIRLDMGEYTTEADTSKLFGAAPGYVGYDNSSALIEGVRKNPYSVILFDEIEKAHPKIQSSILQMLDEGFMTTGTGEKIDMKNTIIIMTSNIGFHNTDSTPISLIGTDNFVNKKRIDESIKDNFTPEFLNRIEKTIHFNSLKEINIKEIAENYMKKFGDFTLTKDELKKLVELADVEKQGARAVQRIVRTEILPNKMLKEKIGTII